MLFELSNDKYQPVQVDALDKRGRPALHYAVAYERKNVANPNLADAEGFTPLHFLCNKYYGDDFLELFFKINDDKRQLLQFNVQDNSGNTPLHLILQLEKYAIKMLVDFLLKNGPDPNVANKEGSTPLRIICQRGEENLHNCSLVELFFQTNESMQRTLQIDARDKLGRTPLQWAVASLVPKTIDTLLNRGANLSNFVFPSECYFATKFKTSYDENFKFRPASATLAVVESLENRGYELDRSDDLTIMKSFDNYGSFEKTTNPEKAWHDDDEFASKAKKIISRPSLSLYDSIGLRPENAAKLVTPEDYFELAFTGMHRYTFLKATKGLVPCICARNYRDDFFGSGHWIVSGSLRMTGCQLSAVKLI